MKKFICTIMAVVALGATTLVAFADTSETTLHIKVNDETKNVVLFNEEVTVDKDVKTLDEFFENADVLDVEMENTEYGNLVVSVLGQVQDNANGSWWSFESDNKKAVKYKDLAFVASEFRVEDGDSITLTLSSDFQG